MARPGPQTMAKRQREQKKMEKRRAKAEKMALRKEQKKLGVDPLAPEEPMDPDRDTDSPPSPGSAERDSAAGEGD